MVETSSGAWIPGRCSGRGRTSIRRRSAARAVPSRVREGVCATLWILAAAPAATAAPTSLALAAKTEFAEEVRFVDERGNVSTFALASSGRLRWCRASGLSPEPKLGCRALQALRVDFKGLCHFQVSFVAEDAEGVAQRPSVLPSAGSASWSAAIAQPAPGPAQRALVAQLLRLAAAAPGLAVGGAASAAGLAVGDAASTVRLLTPPLQFPVAVSKANGNGTCSKVYLRIPGPWVGVNDTGLCVAIVERAEDCNVCVFSGRTCNARALWQLSDPEEYLGFELPRPSSAAAGHAVCLRGGPTSLVGQATPTIVMLGEVVYLPVPKVRFLPNVLRLGVRTFLNPGWHQDIALECVNCTRWSRVAVQPIAPEARCQGVTQESLAALAAAARDGQVPLANVDMVHHANSKVHEIVRSRGSEASLTGVFCKVPAHGPCSAYADHSFSMGSPTSGPEDASEVHFVVASPRRLLARERQALFHHRSALCFYSSEASPRGWLVGFVAVHMDGPDMQAFIGFVCFFGVALPLVCLVTALLHYNKHERCKQHVHHLRLGVQRQQLERELRRATGRATGRGSGDGGGTAAGAPAAFARRAAPPSRWMSRRPMDFWPFARASWASSASSLAGSLEPLAGADAGAGVREL